MAAGSTKCNNTTNQQLNSGEEKMMDVAADKSAGRKDSNEFKGAELHTFWTYPLRQRLSLPHLQKTMHSLSKQPVKRSYYR